VNAVLSRDPEDHPILGEVGAIPRAARNMDPLELQDLVEVLESEVEEFASSQRPRILVVEDEEMFSVLMCTVLSRYGDCEVARTGRKALQAYRSALEEGHPFDLICLDIRLPDLNGDEVLKTLRRYEAVL